MSVVLTCLSGVGLVAPTNGRAGRDADRLGQLTGVDDTGDPKCALESAPPLRQRETSRIEVQVRSPTRPVAGRIGLRAILAGGFLDRDDPQQLGCWRALPTTYTGAYRLTRTHPPDSRQCAT
jgi:hypothetical protein